MLNMRYRVEIEGEETVWMWHYPAAHAKADSASYYDAEGKFHSYRVRTVTITDEVTERVEFHPPVCDIDPMAPNYPALAAEEPTSQAEDCLDAMETVG